MDVKHYILGGGQIKAYESDDLMQFSGWLSTNDIDLTKEIVDAGASKKHFDAYKQAGRLWLNHNKDQVLGRVVECALETTGIRADQCRLSKTKFNEEYVWPHIKEGAFSEFSIQFKSLKGHFDKKSGIYHHEEIYLIESSVVSVACNPSAIIDGFKSLIPSEEWYNASLPELYKLYQDGDLKAPSDHRTNFFVDGLKNMEKNYQEKTVSTPDFMDIVVLDEAKGLDQSGDALPMPSKSRRDYVEVCKAVHLAESDSRGSFLFRVGVPTAKGFKYDWDGVVMTMGSLLGAKGGSFIQEEEKIKAFDRLFKIYATLGKALPKFDATPLNELSDDAIIALKFAEVEFLEGEGETISLNVVKNLSDSISNSVKNMSPEAKETVAKWVYGNMNLCFSVDMYSDDDFDFITSIMRVYEDWKKAKEDSYTLSFPEFMLEQDQKAVPDEEADVNDNTDEEEADEEPVAEEAEESVEEEVKEESELAKALKILMQN